MPTSADKIRQKGRSSAREGCQGGDEMPGLKSLHRLVLLAASCTVVGCATSATTPHVTGTVLTKTADLIHAQRISTSVFSTADDVVCYVYFQWEDPTRQSGYHKVEWRWYQDGRLVSQSKKDLNFKRTPYTVWTHRPAGALGPGRFSVATLVDGVTASSSDFEIRPE
jgi:hypothetical protein